MRTLDFFFARLRAARDGLAGVSSAFSGPCELWREPVEPEDPSASDDPYSLDMASESSLPDDTSPSLTDGDSGGSLGRLSVSFEAASDSESYRVSIVTCFALSLSLNA